MGPTVGSYGTQMTSYDNANTGYCVGVAGGQIQASTETVAIPEQYQLTSGGAPSQIGSVAQTATEDAQGNLTLTKSLASAPPLTVNSAGT